MAETGENKIYIRDFDIKLKILFLLHEIKKEIRFIKGTNLLVNKIYFY
jgi:hypothetical protein